jgi:putative membrane protein
MPLPRVLLSGAFRFSLLYIAVMFSVLELVDPETIIQRVLRSQGRIDQITNTMAANPVLTVVGTVLVAGFFGWISGILVHLTRYYGFQLWLDGDKLRKRHGLFTVTEGTIPLKKVQALILRTNPLMRLFGWYELEVQTVGMNVDEQGHRVIAPFAKYADVLALAQRVRSFDLPDAFGSVSPITIRRRFFRYTVALSALLLPTAYFWPADWWQPGGAALPWWGFALVPLLLGWAVLQYRNHDYAVRDDGLYIRRGVLTHYLWVIPVEKFHVFHATATIFQRRLGLKTLFVDTAGAATFAYPEIIDLPGEEADAQLDRLYRRFQTLYRSRIEAATGAPDTRLDADERPRLPVNANDE